MDFLISADWREQVRYGEHKPSPQILKDDGQIRVILIGLRPGQSMPPHPENKAIYHFLEGTGEMYIDDAVIPITPGATIYAPQDARRGVHADTQLTLLAVRLTE